MQHEGISVSAILAVSASGGVVVKKLMLIRAIACFAR
jgi:hypothetical protein